MEKMKPIECQNLMIMLEKEFPKNIGWYDFGEDCGAHDNHVHLELYGKAYGRGKDGYARYELDGSKMKCLEREGDDLSSLAERINDQFLRHFPKVLTFSLTLQTD